MKTKYFPILLVVIALALITSISFAASTNQIIFAGSGIPRFKQPLPVLDLAGGSIATVDGTQSAEIHLCEFWANVLPKGTFAAGVQPKTRVWGYIKDSCPANGPDDPALDTYLGPVVLATRGTPTRLTFINELGTTETTQVLAYKNSIDQTLHWADPLGDGMNECNMTASMGGMYPDFGSPCSLNYGEGIEGGAPIPAAVHLHGGEVPPELDGGPDSWFTSDGVYKGSGYYTQNPGSDPANGIVYNYPNMQEAAPIWFHDHTLGATRLNVYAGLAGGYLISDPSPHLPAGLNDYGLTRTTNPTGSDITVPLVIQDRMFDTNGQLFFQAGNNGGILWALNPDHPYWSPEFIGDTILVNGKAWPYFNVEPKRYRFLILNGSNARAYEMFLDNTVTKVMGPALYVIATDGGYLNAPVKIDPNATKGQPKRLTILPGERYEVIIDFKGQAAGTKLVLKNVAKAPYPGGTTPNGNTTGMIMQFVVGKCTSGECGAADTSYNPASGDSLRPSAPIVRLVNRDSGTLAAGVTPAKTRALTLNEVMGMPMTAIDPVTGVNTAYPGGPLEVLVNNTKWDGGVDMDSEECLRSDFTKQTINGITTCYSEIMAEGDTEIWEIINLTADAHPIHLHLAQFQLMNRQPFDVGKYLAAYGAAFQGGVYVPSSGPPMNYNPSAASGGKYGGNPDVTPFLKGSIGQSYTYENGWKDTVMSLPGTVTRIVVRWAPTDLAVASSAADLYYPFDPSNSRDYGYVWHCHIIDHEDNEMMRPDFLTLNPAAPTADQRLFRFGFDY